ncbi:MAG TPA: hypothetical protein VFO59_03965, partial [Dehalococcoidia bacterium]|nr:hypothetical protein [Dehalococcoidia bacterium]
APARAPRAKAPAPAAASHDVEAEPWMEVVEAEGEAAPEEAVAAEAAVVAETAPVEVGAEPAEKGPRIRFAEELQPAMKAAPKKVKKGAKQAEEPEGKAKKGPTKKARPLVEDEDIDVDIDFGWDKDADE